MLNKLTTAIVTLALATSLGASSAQAAWIIDLSGSLVDVNDLALTGLPATISEVGGQKGTESPGWARDPEPSPEGVQGRDGEPGPSLKRGPDEAKELRKLEEEAIAAKNKFAQEVAARQQNLHNRQLTIRTRINANENGLTVRQETVNQKGQVIDTKETPLPPKERLRIEQPDHTSLEVEAQSDQQLVINSTKTRTRTNFPLSIQENNTLVITRPDGSEKAVTVLPDAAVANLESKGFTPPSETELIDTADAPVYQTDVKQEKRFLGIFKLVVDKRVTVNTESGEVESALSPRASAWQRFLDRFSF